MWMYKRDEQPKRMRTEEKVKHKVKCTYIK